MWWNYAIVAITCLIVGFMLCAILSANKYNQEFTFDNLPTESEEKDE